MKSDELNPLDCPPGRVYFFDPSQVRQSDLSALPIEEILGAQGDVNRMLELMSEHQRPSLVDNFQGFVLKLEE